MIETFAPLPLCYSIVIYESEQLSGLKHSVLLKYFRSCLISSVYRIRRSIPNIPYKTYRIYYLIFYIDGQPEMLVQVKIRAL